MGHDFGTAIRALKAGKRVCREGWNGKDMWLAYSPGNSALPAEKFWAGPNRDYAKRMGGTAPVLPSITMKTATGEILMGWLASQSDMLATDWRVIDGDGDEFKGEDYVEIEPGADDKKRLDVARALIMNALDVLGVTVEDEAPKEKTDA